MWFEKVKLRGELMKCFKEGEVYIESRSGKKTFHHYPKIHDVKVDWDKKAIRYVFTLPNGCDPKKVLDQTWIFKQHYGSNIEISGDIKKFILWCYVGERIKTYAFDYETLCEQAKGLHIPIIAGKDSQGRMIFYDMIKKPHMLVMGETGSGKSVYIRSVITFLSMYMRNNIEIYTADMKRTEFFLFRHLDNVKGNVTKKEKLLHYLNKIHKQLEHRGDLMDEAEVSHIDDYNALPTTKKKLPYILLCIDEVALLKKEKDIMEHLENISCIGRALGCLMILSMQRGDATILEGNLKNNLTVRSVFRCADKINSDIGLGQGSEMDASQIPMDEKGKFICRLEGMNMLQAPLLEVEEAKKLLKPYKKEPEQIEAEEIIEQEAEESSMLFDFGGVMYEHEG